MECDDVTTLSVHHRVNVDRCPSGASQKARTHKELDLTRGREGGQRMPELIVETRRLPEDLRERLSECGPFRRQSRAYEDMVLQCFWDTGAITEEAEGAIPPSLRYLLTPPQLMCNAEAAQPDRSEMDAQRCRQARKLWGIRGISAGDHTQLGGNAAG